MVRKNEQRSDRATSKDLEHLAPQKVTKIRVLVRGVPIGANRCRSAAPHSRWLCDRFLHLSECGRAG